MTEMLLLAAASLPSEAFLGPIPRPVAYRVSVRAGRVEGKALPVKISPSRGEGRWIWTTGKPTSVQFSRSFQLDSVPRSGTIRITSECGYRLYVNGQIVARGPADVGRDYDIGPTGPWLYDVVDVTRWLRKGSNALAVEVVGRPLVQSEGSLGKPGLWLEADLGKLRLQTDATWKARANSDIALEPASAGEPLHGRGDFLTLGPQVSPEKWGSQTWSPATLAPDAERRLLQSEIPSPMEANYPDLGYIRPTGAVALNPLPTFSGAGAVALRFDRVLSGHIVVRVRGGKGAILTVMPNEANAPGYHRAVRLKLQGGSQSFEVPFFDSFSTLNLEATGVQEPIVIEEVRAVFRSYPMRYRGKFECSDPTLTEYWKVGRWSTQICMQTHHLDSPHHQEPISDPGDYLIQSLISYYAFGEAGLARQDLRKYGQIIRDRKSRVFHTSYALLWLQMLTAYWQHTGDESLVRELAPTAFDLLATWETWRGDNGLISNPPNFMFIDWVELEGFNLHHPPAVIGQGVLTGFYYRALEDGVRIAKLMGDSSRVDLYDRLRREVKVAFRRELWSAEKGLFRDGKPNQSRTALGTWLPADKPIETFSSQVNILACAYGLISGERAKQVLTAVMQSGPAECQPYFMHFAFDALYQTGLFSAWATPQMRRWKLVEDSQSFKEMWDRGDLSHSWQCTPTYQLSARVLGVQPLTPGYQKFLVRPQPCDLKWASGTVPTPHGDIHVRWDAKPDRFILKVNVPQGTTAVIQLPDGSQKEVGPGSHTIQAVSPAARRPSLAFPHRHGRITPASIRRSRR